MLKQVQYDAEGNPLFSFPFLLGRNADGTNGQPVVALVVVHVVIDRIEVEFPRVVRKVRAERTRPVVAIGTGIGELTAVADARSGQEDEQTIVTTRKQHPIYPI